MLTECSLSISIEADDCKGKTSVSEPSKRQLLIEIAKEVIAERGPTRFSTREVARRAGVSEALIFHHFETKLGLLKAVAASSETLLAEVTRLVSGPAADPIGRIAALCAKAAHILRPDMSGGIFFATIVMRGEASRKMSGAAFEQLRLTRNALAEWLDRCAETGVVRLNTDGTTAAQSLFEGILWLVVFLPEDPVAWDEAAPAAFSELHERWALTHFVSVPSDGTDHTL
jgi:AcrR family transcriptional regulator